MIETDSVTQRGFANRHLTTLKPMWNHTSKLNLFHSLSLPAAFQVNPSGRRKYVSIMVDGYPVCLQLDTAKDSTTISEQLWRTLESPPAQPTSQVFVVILFNCLVIYKVVYHSTARLSQERFACLILNPTSFFISISLRKQDSWSYRSLPYVAIHGSAHAETFLRLNDNV